MDVGRIVNGEVFQSPTRRDRHGLDFRQRADLLGRNGTGSLRFRQLREEALRDPERTEVRDGVARAPSSEEAL